MLLPRKRLIKASVLVVILAAFQVSCKERLNSKSKKLSNSSQKYWTLIREYPLRNSYGMVFYSDGKYYPYYEVNKKRVVSNMHIGGNSWELVGDSLLVLNDSSRFKIEYLNDEILVLNNIKTKELLVYQISENQTTPAKGDTTRNSLNM